MMSPNGSIPPIHVPPGYISQVCAKSPSSDHLISDGIKYFMSAKQNTFFFFSLFELLCFLQQLSGGISHSCFSSLKLLIVSHHVVFGVSSPQQMSYSLNQHLGNICWNTKRHKNNIYIFKQNIKILNLKHQKNGCALYKSKHQYCLNLSWSARARFLLKTKKKNAILL